MLGITPMRIKLSELRERQCSALSPPSPLSLFSHLRVNKHKISRWIYSMPSKAPQNPAEVWSPGRKIKQGMKNPEQVSSWGKENRQEQDISLPSAVLRQEAGARATAHYTRPSLITATLHGVIRKHTLHQVGRFLFPVLLTKIHIPFFCLIAAYASLCHNTIWAIHA